MFSGSVMTVVVFHSEAGENQYIFTPKWTYWKDLFVYCKTTWGSAIKDKAFSDFKVEAKYKYPETKILIWISNQENNFH